MKAESAVAHQGLEICFLGLFSLGEGGVFIPGEVGGGGGCSLEVAAARDHPDVTL